MGRPLKFKTPEELDLMVDLYVENCRQAERIMTLPGLALFLGFSCRQSLYDYEKREQFADGIKRARALVEQDWVELAARQSGAGPIFMLKNMGYTDKQEVKVDPITINLSGEITKL